jgi:hypothetical protein
MRATRAMTAAPGLAMGVRVPVATRDGDDLDRALKDSARREQFFGRRLQLVRAASHYDDLEAPVVIQVHVHGRSHLVAQLVLHVGDSILQLAHVVVVHDGHAGERIDALPGERPHDLGSREVPYELGPGASPFPDELVELTQQRRFHRDPESREV